MWSILFQRAHNCRKAPCYASALGTVTTRHQPNISLSKCFHSQRPNCKKRVHFGKLGSSLGCCLNNYWWFLNQFLEPSLCLFCCTPLTASPEMFGVPGQGVTGPSLWQTWNFQRLDRSAATYSSNQTGAMCYLTISFPFFFCSFLLETLSRIRFQAFLFLAPSHFF